MPNPTPNSFVSNYKNFLVKTSYSINDVPVWEVLDKTSKKVIGKIKNEGTGWEFYPNGALYPQVQTFTHLQLLDIAAAIKAVEKRTDLPNLY